MKTTRVYPKRGYTAFIPRTLHLNGRVFTIASDRAYVVDKDGNERRAYKLHVPDPENPGTHIRATDMLKRHLERCREMKLDPFETPTTPTADEVRAWFEQNQRGVT